MDCGMDCGTDQIGVNYFEMEGSRVNCTGKESCEKKWSK